ncbi:protein kinase, putative (ISS) [Carpediemonas membranifera]|uniref:Protein kinase, putative (ISS) n=1 Tax=Carpediemonas membranifera TaxID=201153 RepID=A0A8J6ATU4_9EUKA|nr:protein kinase, putative (ISS) [Carpediemonas membranifera]|eukprot:KAG9391320.1 protein kinase, putative (ISS) [Carpediemonas membranifera]
MLRPFETLGNSGEISSVAVSSDNLFVGMPDANSVLVYAFSANYKWYHLETLTGTGSFGTSVAYTDGVLLVGNPSLGSYGGFHVYTVDSNVVTFVADITDGMTNTKSGDTIAVALVDTTLYALIGCDVIDTGTSSALVLHTASTTDLTSWSFGATLTVAGSSLLGKELSFGSGGSHVAVVSGVIDGKEAAFTVDVTTLDADAGTVQIFDVVSQTTSNLAAAVMNGTKIFTVDSTQPYYGDYTSGAPTMATTTFGDTPATLGIATDGPWVGYAVSAVSSPANVYYDVAVVLSYYDSDEGSITSTLTTPLAPDVTEDDLTVGVMGLWMADGHAVLLDGTSTRLFTYKLSPCLPGFEMDSDQCVPCRAGYYSASTDMHHCLRCPPGTYQPSTGQNECLAVTAGYTLGAATTTTACPAGYTSYATLYPTDYSTASQQAIPTTELVGSYGAQSPSLVKAGDFIVLGSYVDGSSLGAVLYFNPQTVATDSYTLLRTSTDGDGYGMNIAATDDYLVVGAYKTSATVDDEGAVYVYEIGSSSIDYYAIISNHAPAFESHFGVCVAVSGTTIAVGAQLDTSIYFYELVDGTFTLDNGLTKTGVTIDEFSSMVMNDDFLVYNDGSSLSSSTVTVYSASYSSALSHQYSRRLRSALYGSTLVMGSAAATDPVSSIVGTGEVHVYDLFDAPTTSKLAQILRLEGATEDTMLGFSVAYDGTRIIAGTPSLNVDYNYYGGYTTWTQDNGGTWTLESQRVATGPTLFIGNGVAELDSFIVTFGFDDTDTSQVILDITRVGVNPQTCIATAVSQRCQAGQEWDSDAGACVACGQGTLSSTYGSMCHAPAPGYIPAASTGATAEAPCPTGQHPDILGTVCEVTGTGSMSYWDSTYRACNGAGEYQDEAGQTVCKVNDLGYEPSDTRTSQVMCSSGYYQNETRQDSCKTADKGFHVDGSGDHSSQTACDGTGEYQDETAQSSCKTAEKGYAAAADRLSVVECNSGQYQDTAAQDSCKDCGMDEFSGATGAQTSCGSCPSGFDQFLSKTACAATQLAVSVGLNESSTSTAPVFEVYPADTPYTLAKGSTWDSTSCVIETVDSAQVIRCSQETSAATLAYSLTIDGTKADYSSDVTMVTLAESEYFITALTLASPGTTEITPDFDNSDITGGTITLSVDDSVPDWVGVSAAGTSLKLTPSAATASGTYTVTITAKNGLDAVDTATMTLTYLAVNTSSIVPKTSDKPTGVINVNGTETNGVAGVSCDIPTSYFSKVDSNRAFVVPVANADGTLPAGSYTMTVTMSDGSTAEVYLTIDSESVDPNPAGTVTISESSIDVTTPTQLGFCAALIDAGTIGGISTSDIAVDPTQTTASCVGASTVTSAALSGLPFGVVLDPEVSSTVTTEAMPSLVIVEVPDSASGVKTQFESVGTRYTMTVGNYTGTASANEGRLVLGIDGQSIDVNITGIVDVTLAYDGVAVYSDYFTIVAPGPTDNPTDDDDDEFSSTTIILLAALGLFAFIATVAIVAFSFITVAATSQTIKLLRARAHEKAKATSYPAV